MRFVLLCVFVLSACGGTAREGGAPVKYVVSAKDNYQKGMDALRDEDWIDAAKFFSFVKARFPYSKYAVLADLRLADTLFGSGNYQESIDAYKLFVKYHPTHQMAANGYAAFKIGYAHYKTLPGDWFLLPPSHEKDQTTTRETLRALHRFLKRFPDSPYRERAEDMYKKCAFRLASHEWYVANYYWKRNKPEGTVLRLKGLLGTFPGVGFDTQAMWLLGQAYARVKRPAKARETWDELITKHPKSPEAMKAKRAIARLPSK